MAISDRQFPGLCDVLGTAHWLDDVRFCSMELRIRFCSMELRIENAAALGDLVEIEFAQHNGDDLVAALHAKTLPLSGILSKSNSHNTTATTWSPLSTRETCQQR